MTAWRGGNQHVHLLAGTCRHEARRCARYCSLLQGETYEGSPSGHPAEGLGELRALHLQLLQELGRQADVHGQGKTLADILRRGPEERVMKGGLYRDIQGEALSNQSWYECRSNGCSICGTLSQRKKEGVRACTCMGMCAGLVSHHGSHAECAQEDIRARV